MAEYLCAECKDTGAVSPAKCACGSDMTDIIQKCSGCGITFSTLTGLRKQVCLLCYDPLHKRIAELEALVAGKWVEALMYRNQDGGYTIGLGYGLLRKARGNYRTKKAALAAIHQALEENNG